MEYHPINAIASFVLLLAVLGSVVYLSKEKIIDGEAAIGIITSIVTLAGGAIAVHSGVKAGARAAKSKD